MQNAEAFVDGGKDAVGFRGEGGTVDAHRLVASLPGEGDRRRRIAGVRRIVSCRSAADRQTPGRRLGVDPGVCGEVQPGTGAIMPVRRAPDRRRSAEDRGPVGVCN